MQITELTTEQINTVLNNLSTTIATSAANSTQNLEKQRTTTIHSGNEVLIAPTYKNVTITLQNRSSADIQILKSLVTANSTIEQNLFVDSNWSSPQFDYALTKQQSAWFVDNWKTLPIGYLYTYFDFKQGWSGAQSYFSVYGPTISFNLPNDIKIVGTGNQKRREDQITVYYLRLRTIGSTVWDSPIRFVLDPFQSNIINNYDTTIVGGDNAYLSVEQGNEAGIPAGIYTNTDIYFTNDNTGIKDPNGNLIVGTDNGSTIVRDRNGTEVINDRNGNFDYLTANHLTVNNDTTLNTLQVNGTGTVNGNLTNYGNLATNRIDSTQIVNTGHIATANEDVTDGITSHRYIYQPDDAGRPDGTVYADLNRIYARKGIYSWQGVNLWQDDSFNNGIVPRVWEVRNALYGFYLTVS